MYLATSRPPNLPAAVGACFAATSAIEDVWPEASDFSWAAGNAGLATAYLALRLRTSDEWSARRSELLLRRCLTQLRVGGASPGLFSGVAGVAWTLTHAAAILNDASFLRAAGTLCRTLGDALRSGRLDSLGVDLITGLTGVGVAAHAFGDATSDYSLLEVVANAIIARGTEHPHGLHWPTEVTHLPIVSAARYPNGCQDFGPAHGHVGVMSFLHRASQPLRSQRGVLEAAESSAAWLQSQFSAELIGPLLPAVVSGDRKQHVSHFGWCYSDLGCAAVTCAVAAYCSSSTLHRIGDALRIRASAGYRERRTTSVTDDLSLCHGSPSTAMLLRSFDLSTDAAEEIGAASVLDEGITARVSSIASDPRTALAGISPPQIGPPAASYGLLMGPVGTILHALSVAENRRGPWWAEPFLLTRKSAQRLYRES